MFDPEYWLRVHQQDREREIQAAHRANLLHAAGGAHRSTTHPLGTLGRSVGRTLVRVGLWLMVAD